MQQTNPKIYYHVFLHKIDADNLALEEKKNGFFFFFLRLYNKDVLNNIKETINEELELNGHKSINISYHLTTFILNLFCNFVFIFWNRIYECSLIECFSKVTHKVIA